MKKTSITQQLRGQGVSRKDVRIAHQLAEAIAMFNNLIFEDTAVISFNCLDVEKDELALYDHSRGDFVIYTHDLAKKIDHQGRQKSYAYLDLSRGPEDGSISPGLIVCMIAAHEVRHRMQFVFQKRLRWFSGQSTTSRELVREANDFVAAYLRLMRRVGKIEKWTKQQVRLAAGRREHDAHVIGLVVLHSIQDVANKEELKDLFWLQPD